MFVFSKIFSIFLSPLLWIVLFTIWIFILKPGKKKKWFVFIWVVLLYVFTTHSVVVKLVSSYEMPYQPIAKGKIFDCAIVLSGGSHYDSFSSSLQFNQAAERLTEPVILYRKGIVKKLMITGGSANVFPPYQKEAVYVKMFWKDMGVAEKDIIIESESRNTIENAIFSKRLLEDSVYLKKNILLITSALHAPRSEYIFKKNGFEVDMYPVDFIISRGGESKFRIENNLLPKSGAIVLWEALIHEWVGMLAAKLK
jgi:uncharacterized SAM-binding protein YcdF (DUF218 family)